MKLTKYPLYYSSALLILVAVAWVAVSGFRPGSSKPEGRVMGFLEQPQRLLGVWQEAPLPLSTYSAEELAVQLKLNGKEAGLWVYAPEAAPGEAPQVAGMAIDREAITPTTWKWVEFELVTESDVFEVWLRRPNHWISDHKATAVGNKVWLEMPEMDVVGEAVVKALHPNQLDSRLWQEQRKGDYVLRPLTGKIVHSNQVSRLGFSGGTVVETTAYHPFYSQDRRDYVRAGELVLGEQVKTRLGVAKLLEREALAGSQKVYNLEVYQHHNYLVGEDGLLVHNSCPGWGSKYYNIHNRVMDAVDHIWVRHGHGTTYSDVSRFASAYNKYKIKGLVTEAWKASGKPTSGSFTYDFGSKIIGTSKSGVPTSKIKVYMGPTGVESAHPL